MKNYQNHQHQRRQYNNLISPLWYVYWPVLWCALALCVVALPPVPRVQAQQETVPTIETYEGWLREAFAAAQRNDRPGLEAVAENLTSIEAVQSAEGARIPVHNEWLAQELGEADPDLDQIGDRLGALLDALAQPESAVPDDAQQRLDDVLNNPPFASDSEAADGDWVQAFFDWLSDTLDRILSPVGEAGSAAGPLIQWILIAICVLLLGGVLVYLLLHMRRSLTREAQAAPESDFEAQLTATSALQQATSLARDGDYRTAVRYLYLSSLLWLDERELLRYDRALTNREYVASLASNPDLQARLVPIVETFDRVWYGHTTLDADSFQAYQQRVEELRNAPRPKG
jgi:hypothetical protein